MSAWRSLPPIGMGLLPILCACSGAAPAVPFIQSRNAPEAAPLSTSQCRSIGAPGQTRNQLYWIDNKGEIVGDDALGGYTIRLPYRQRDYHYARYPNARSSIATAKSDSGVLVGYYRNRRNQNFSFTYAKGVWTSLPSPRAGWDMDMLAINNAGVQAGVYVRDSNYSAFATNNKDAKYGLLNPPGSKLSVADGINGRGDVVGTAVLKDGSAVGFVFKGGKYTELSYPDAVATRFYSVTIDDVIAGAYDDAAGATHGLIATRPLGKIAWHRFDYPKADNLTILTSINQRGEVVGYYRDKGGRTEGLLCF